MNKVNILFQSNYSSFKRGGQRSLSYILRDIDRTKYNPVLLCREEGELNEFAKKLGIPVEILKIPRIMNIFGDITYSLSLLRILKKYDINLFHSEELVCVCLARLASLIKKIMIIWHVRVKWDNMIHKRIGFLVSDAIICVSNAVKEGFPGSDKLFVAENGVDPSLYENPGILKEYFNQKYIGYFAEISAHKGVEVILRAMPEVLKKHSDAKLLIAGTGESQYIEQLKKICAELKIKDSVIWHGFESERLIQLINSMDIVLVPSIYGEGLSRTLLETMAIGKAIIASDIPQNKELITENINGKLAEKLNSGDYSRKIVYLLSNAQERAIIGNNARITIMDKYTVKQTIEKVYYVYHSLGF